MNFYQNPQINVVISSYESELFHLEGKVYRTTSKNTIKQFKSAIWRTSISENSNKYIDKRAIQFPTRSDLTDESTISDLLNATLRPGIPSMTHVPVKVNWVENEKAAEDDNDDEKFDILINFGETGLDISNFRVRGTLNDTIRKIKEKTSQGLTDAGLWIGNASHYEMVYKIFDENESDYENPILTDDSGVGEILGLDIVPVDEVEFFLRRNTRYPIAASSNGRFHIKIDGEIDFERNLIEVTLSSTTLQMKQKIIEILSATSVVRYFEEQLHLFYGGKLLLDKETLTQSLHLNEPPRGVIVLKLVVSPYSTNLSQFWKNLKDSDRFKFLPVITNDGVIEDIGNSNSAGDSSAVNNEEGEEVVPEPTRTVPEVNPLIPLTIKLENGDNLFLSGDSYETITQKNEILMINQRDVSSVNYVLTIDTPNGPKDCILSTSQCIINDTPGHEPYLLLSPSGMSKLHNAGAQISQVTVTIDDRHHDSTSESSRTINDGNEQINFNENNRGHIVNETNNNNDNRNNVFDAARVPRRPIAERLRGFFQNGRLNRLTSFFFILGRVFVLLYVFEFQELMIVRPILSVFLIFMILLFNFTRADFINNFRDILRHDFGLLRNDNDLGWQIIGNINHHAATVNDTIREVSQKVLLNLLPVRGEEEGEIQRNTLYVILSDVLLFFVTLIPAWQVYLDFLLNEMDTNTEIQRRIALAREAEQIQVDDDNATTHNGDEQAQNDGSSQEFVEVDNNLGRNDVHEDGVAEDQDTDTESHFHSGSDREIETADIGNDYGLLRNRKTTANEEFSEFDRAATSSSSRHHNLESSTKDRGQGRNSNSYPAALVDQMDSSLSESNLQRLLRELDEIRNSSSGATRNAEGSVEEEEIEEVPVNQVEVGDGGDEDEFPINS